MDKTVLSILAGLGGMFGWGTSDFFANISSEKIGHFKAFFWSQVAGICICLLLIPFFGINSGLSLWFLGIFTAASVCYAIGYLLFYKAFEIGNVSIVSAAINLNVVIAMLIAAIFSGQRLSPIQTLAVMLVMAGVILVTVNFKDLKNNKFKLLAGVRESVLASLFFGVYWNLSELLSEQLGWLPSTLYVKIGAIIFLLGFAYFKKQQIKLVKLKNKIKVMVALVGILEALAVACVNFGLEVGDLVLVSPISSALSVVTITLAVIFLKEKITKLQTLGIMVVILGIVMTAF